MDLAPQFASLQDRLGALGAPPLSPPGPQGAPVLPVVNVPPAPVIVPGGGAPATGILSSPWLWVALAVLLLVGLFIWYKSQKKKK